MINSNLNCNDFVMWELRKIIKCKKFMHQLKYNQDQCKLCIESIQIN